MAYQNLPNLNDSVLAALDFLIKNPPKPLNLSRYNFPIVIGSGNAFNVAKILFFSQSAILGNESNYQSLFKSYAKLIKNGVIKQAVIISASGEKDSIPEIKAAQKNGLKTTLLTCNPQSTGAKLADQVILYPRIPEPQTYNVCTYLGMFSSVGQNNLRSVKSFLKNLKLPKKFSDYRAYSIILPDSFGGIAPMLDIKKSELFGSHLALRSFSYGEARHAKFVIPWDKELVISLGPNSYFGKPEHRWEITLPKDLDNAFIMALTYFLIGKIQEIKPDYFRKNIATWCQEGARAFQQDQPFQIIVQ